MVALEGPAPRLGGVNPKFIVLGGVFQAQGPVVAQPQAALGRRVGQAQEGPLPQGGQNGLEAPAVVRVGVVVPIQIAVKAQKILLPVEGRHIPEGFGQVVELGVGQKEPDARVAQQGFQPGALQSRHRQCRRMLQQGEQQSLPLLQQRPGVLVQQLGDELEGALPIAPLSHQRLHLASCQRCGAENVGHHLIIAAVNLGKELHYSSPPYMPTMRRTSS